MTITYQAEVASIKRFGVFWKLLCRWKGSIYKLVWPDLCIYIFLYFTLNFSYRFAMNDLHKKLFEEVSRYCANFSNFIPMSFVLGFYVTIVVQRWWEQYIALPWPDSTAVFVSTNIQGNDERGRLIRRTIMRYVNLSFVYTMSQVCTRVKKRFPTLDHLTEAGIMTEKEKKIFEVMNQKSQHPKFWMPLVWAGSIVTKARREGRIKDDFAVKTLVDSINSFRSGLGNVLNYDWISVPLVYTQTVTLAVYTFFMAELMGRQFVANGGSDLYVPIFTFLQFFFYMGWLRVAETLFNPFGDDDDDFEINWMIDRNLQVSYIIVDEMHEDHPELVRDQYWEDVVPPEMPYTVAAEQYRREPPQGSAAQVELSKVEMTLVEPAPPATSADSKQHDDSAMPNDIEMARSYLSLSRRTPPQPIPVTATAAASAAAGVAARSASGRVETGAAPGGSCGAALPDDAALAALISSTAHSLASTSLGPASLAAQGATSIRRSLLGLVRNISRTRGDHAGSAHVADRVSFRSVGRNSSRVSGDSHSQLGGSHAPRPQTPGTEQAISEPDEMFVMSDLDLATGDHTGTVRGGPHTAPPVEPAAGTRPTSVAGSETGNSTVAARAGAFSRTSSNSGTIASSDTKLPTSRFLPGEYNFLITPLLEEDERPRTDQSTPLTGGEGVMQAAGVGAAAPSDLTTAITNSLVPEESTAPFGQQSLLKDLLTTIIEAAVQQPGVQVVCPSAEDSVAQASSGTVATAAQMAAPSVSSVTTALSTTGQTHPATKPPAAALEPASIAAEATPIATAMAFTTATTSPSTHSAPLMPHASSAPLREASLAASTPGMSSGVANLSAYRGHSLQSAEDAVSRSASPDQAPANAAAAASEQEVHIDAAVTIEGETGVSAEAAGASGYVAYPAEDATVAAGVSGEARTAESAITVPPPDSERSRSPDGDSEATDSSISHLPPDSESARMPLLRVRKDS